jgi:hypothetical protein
MRSPGCAVRADIDTMPMSAAATPHQRRRTAIDVTKTRNDI